MSTGMTKSKELKLIRQAAKGDLDAATMLIRCHQASVFMYIKRMCGRDELAEDVTQEAFSRVLLNLDRFDAKYRFSTWLFTIARRVFLNICEKKKPISDSDRLSTTMCNGCEVGSGLEASDEREKDKDMLDHAMLALTPDQREIIVLFHQHEWPIWMIADQLTIPEGTVKSHLFRGRVKLREEYTRLEAAIEQARRLAIQQAAAAKMGKPIPVNSRSSILPAMDGVTGLGNPSNNSGVHAAILSTNAAVPLGEITEVRAIGGAGGVGSVGGVGVGSVGGPGASGFIQEVWA